MSANSTSRYEHLPEHLHATAREAAADGMSGLDADQLDGLACVHCRRTTRDMWPLEGWYGGRQLFACADGIACAAAAEQLPGGYEPGAMENPTDG